MYVCDMCGAGPVPRPHATPPEKGRAWYPLQVHVCNDLGQIEGGGAYDVGQIHMHDDRALHQKEIRPGYHQNYITSSATYTALDY